MTANDWSDIEPVPADWFSPGVRYEGEGRATFGDPPSAVSGHVVVSCDEYGNATARMTNPVIVSSEREFRLGPSELLLSMPPCLGLTVTTADGCFDAGSKVFYDYEETNLFHAPEDSSTVTVDSHWLRAQFVGTTASEARYWVLPLLNFLFNPNQRDTELDQHPLRVYPTPIVPEESDPDRAFFREYANQKNRLVIFEYNGAPGFIERLADYSDREARLASRPERRLITALMVGTAGGDSDTWESLGKWFPFDLLGVLGMASGAEVGAPWVEFRDGEGVLVRRWHVPLGTPDYHKGHAAIHEAVHAGTGNLITRACACEDFGATHLRVAVRHLVDGLPYEQPIEERLGHFCRGIDGLCKAHGLTGRNLLDEIKSEYRNRVKKAIAGAASAIEAVAAEVAGAGDLADSKTLRQIARRTRSNPAYVDYHFGNAAIRLMERSGLADAEVMARFLANEDGDIVEGRRRWAKWLTDCRGIAMHGGYFDIAAGVHDSQFLWQTTQHLLDILLRIMLKALQYEGTYQPSVSRTLDAQPLDWMRPETAPQALGYR